MEDFRMRDVEIVQCGFVRLTVEVVDYLAALCQGKRVLDAGSGTGYLARQLELRCISVTAVDCNADGALGQTVWRKSQVIWKRDIVGDAVPLVSQHDTVLLCWPSLHVPFAANVARAMRPGQLLIYEGEDEYGCTADTDFFAEVRAPHWKYRRELSNSLNQRHRQWFGIHDEWSVWERLPLLLEYKGKQP
jgi:predicted O-methyltransferase YrrM